MPYSHRFACCSVDRIKNPATGAGFIGYCAERTARAGLLPDVIDELLILKFGIREQFSKGRRAVDRTGVPY